jgi:bifunctional ADP-heptose synthase (sugar kinase/adenylyltransferase)
VPATVVTPNYAEANALIAHIDNTFSSARSETLLSSSALEHVGRRVLDTMQAEYVAVTLGARGVAVFHRNAEMLHVEAHSVQRADDVGAGDSFISGMALALATGGDVEAAVRIGIDAAAIAVAKQRTAIVDQQELLRRVSIREYATRAEMQSPVGPQNAPALAAYLHADLSAGPDAADHNQ